MSRALVVYATKTGCTEVIAAAVGEALTALGVTADVAAADTQPDPAGYDAVIVGSGVRAGMWHASAKRWLGSHASDLAGRPLALFTACLTMGTNPEKADEVRAYTDPVITEFGLEPVDVGLFAGMNVPREFSLPERLVLRAMKAPEGDFRDLDAVAAWSRETARSLGLA